MGDYGVCKRGAGRPQRPRPWRDACPQSGPRSRIAVITLLSRLPSHTR
jgi:hypothetical protein